jgi:hypothetical protein
LLFPVVAPAEKFVASACTFTEHGTVMLVAALDRNRAAQTRVPAARACLRLRLMPATEAGLAHNSKLCLLPSAG